MATLTIEPKHQWFFNETGATYADSQADGETAFDMTNLAGTGGSNTGKVNNAADGAIEIEGATDRVGTTGDFSGDPSFGGGTFSVAFWIYMGSFSNSGQYIFVGENTINDKWSVDITNGGVFSFRVDKEGGGNAGTIEAGTLSTNTWYHFAMTVVDTGAVNVYRDGNATPIATGSLSGGSPETLTSSDTLQLFMNSSSAVTYRVDQLMLCYGAISGNVKGNVIL